MAMTVKVTLRILLVLSVSLCVLSQELTVVVDVPDLGKIQGNRAFTARDARPYWVFHGVPYAENASYTGSNRFQPSEVQTNPLSEPGCVFLANRLRVICPQNAIFDLPEENVQDLAAVLSATTQSKRQILKSIREANSVEEAKSAVPKYWGQEDCLTININTPRIPTSEDDDLLPVILFFHGGGSDSIWGSAFTGLRLMDKDVLLLTVNYRLGALGALNLGVDEAPGAAALYDAVTALKWIQRYIRHFGGDPNKVTITGQSAGAMMVTHLLLSPLAAGLFHGVWGFSGSALNVWATTPHPSISHHLDVAHYAGCYDRGTGEPSDMKVVAQCMAGKDIQEIITASNLYEEQETSAGRLGFDGKGPASLQSPTLTIPRFLAEEPFEILKQGKQSPVPLVLGATRHDGSFPLDDLYTKYLLPSGQLENATYVQNVMLKELMTTFGVKDDSGGLYHAMAHEFLGDAANTDDFDSKIPGLIDVATVFGYKGGQYRFIEYHAKVQPKSYFYSFDYKGKFTLYNILWGLDKKIPGGICHTDDMMYLFYLLPMLNDDMKVTRRMVDYFVNFATYGDPNGPNLLENPAKVQWPQFDNVNHSYFIINRKDKIGYDCPDTWSGVSLELIKPEARITAEETSEALSFWRNQKSGGKSGRTDWGESNNLREDYYAHAVCSVTDSTTEGTTQNPVESTDNPIESTNNPIESTDNPIESSQHPVESTDNPVESTHDPIETTPPVEPTQNTLETTQRPIETTQPPIETTLSQDISTIEPSEKPTGASSAVISSSLIVVFLLVMTYLL